MMGGVVQSRKKSCGTEIWKDFSNLEFFHQKITDCSDVNAILAPEIRTEFIFFIMCVTSWFIADSSLLKHEVGNC